MVMAMAEDLSTAQNREKQHDMDLDIPAKDRLIVALDVSSVTPFRSTKSDLS